MKKIWIVLIVIIVLALPFSYWMLTKSSTTTAFLNIESGKVEVDSGNGWKDAKDQMELSLRDKIRTLAGKATVILYESIIVSLEPNTEIMLQDLAKEHVRVKQSSGSTWNKFTGLLGVDGYSVETPTSVASIRGTFFIMGMDNILVGEGSVGVVTKNKTLVMVAGNKLVIGNTTLNLLNLTAAEKALVLEKMKEALTQMKNLRQREIEKNAALISSLKSTYGVTDSQIADYMDKIDNGEVSLEDIKSKIPVQLESLDKIEELTGQIIEQNKEISNLK